mmetsp:Transcript_21668/g.24933  ORF Transcript_21668/g.24933 Transcript_21668/m.24933 type:complete len:97 (+) Transcript_21668:60-350(+)
MKFIMEAGSSNSQSRLQPTSDTYKVSNSSENSFENNRESKFAKTADSAGLVRPGGTRKQEPAEARYFTEKTTSVLVDWLKSHINHPYPSEEERTEL